MAELGAGEAAGVLTPWLELLGVPPMLAGGRVVLVALLEGLQEAVFMGLSQQEYWSGLPFPSLGCLPDQGIKLLSPTLAGGFFSH